MADFNDGEVNLIKQKRIIHNLEFMHVVLVIINNCFQFQVLCLGVVV